MFLLAYHAQNCEPLESPHSVDFLKTDESLLKLFGRNVFEVLLTLFLTLTRVSVKHNFFFVACDNCLRQAHDIVHDCCVRQEKCRSILKHVLKRYDNRKSCLRPVVSLSHATKSHRVNRVNRYDFVACDNGLRQAHDMIYDCCVRQKKCRSILQYRSDVP